MGAKYCWPTCQRQGTDSPPEAFSCDLSVCLHVGFPRVGLFPWGLVSLNACFPLNRLVWLLSAEKPGFSLQTAQRTHRCFFSRFLLGSLPCSRSCSLFGALSLHVSCGNTNTAWRADYPWRMVRAKHFLSSYGWYFCPATTAYATCIHGQHLVKKYYKPNDKLRNKPTKVYFWPTHRGHDCVLGKTYLHRASQLKTRVPFWSRI